MHTADKIYDNCSVLSPESQLMFRTSTRRAKWYVDNQLAEVVQAQPFIIKLTFQPNGTGDEHPFFLQDKENICSVCGFDEDLSRHHVVPHCYRKYCESKYGAKLNWHDILPLCIYCHLRYERKADSLKKKLASQYSAPIPGIPKDDDEYKYKKWAKKVQNEALAIRTYGHKIPPQRQQEMMQNIANFLGIEEDLLTQVAIDQLMDDPTKFNNWEKYSHGELVIAQVDDIVEFSKIWRNHFVNIMKPKFLPKYWSIDFDPLYRV